MPLRFLAALLLLALPLALLACGDDADVEIETPPSEIDAPDLLGYWVVVERDGEVPVEEVRYQFTPQGEVIVYESAAEPARAQYSFASEDQILVEDAAGTRFYEFDLDGDRLTMSAPGEEGEQIALRRLADVDLEEVPAPPPSTSIPEDSLPPDSLDNTPMDTNAP